MHNKLNIPHQMKSIIKSKSLMDYTQLKKQGKQKQKINHYDNNLQNPNQAKSFQLPQILDSLSNHSSNSHLQTKKSFESDNQSPKTRCEQSLKPIPEQDQIQIVEERVVPLNIKEFHINSDINASFTIEESDFDWDGMFSFV